MLDIQPSLLAFEIIIFLALVAILNQILYKPMLGFMDERASSLKADVDIVDAHLSERKAILAEADKVLADAKAESSKIRHEAIAAAKVEAASKIAAAKEAAEADISQYLTEINSQKAELKAVIASNADSFKASLAAALNK